MRNAPEIELSKGYVLKFLHGQYFWIGSYDNPHDSVILTSNESPRKFFEKAIADLNKEEALQAKCQKKAKAKKKKASPKCSGCGHAESRHIHNLGTWFCHATARCNCVNFGKGVGK